MISDPVRLLRALNPEPAVTAPPIDRLWSRLEAQGIIPAEDDASADRSAQPPISDAPAERAGVGRSHRGGGWPSRLLVAGLLVVTTATGVGAILVLHASPRAAITTPAGRQALPSPARGLVGILGILRRPQTPADRDLGPSLTDILRHRLGGTPVMSLVRVAAVTPDGQKVVLVPMRPRNGRGWPPGPPGSGATSRSTGLRLAIFAGGGGCCSTPAAIEAAGAWSSAGSSSGNYVVIVVPDGVARVRVALAHPINALVHHNVTVFTTPQAVENLGIYPMTWFGPSGDVVKRFASSMPAAKPTDVVIKDCLAHGQLMRVYPVARLRRALADLPPTVRRYTNCAATIRRAIQHQSRPK